MVRPTLPASRRRSRQLPPVRVTPVERKVIRDMARDAKLSESRFLRWVIFGSIAAAARRSRRK